MTPAARHDPCAAFQLVNLTLVPSCCCAVRRICNLRSPSWLPIRMPYLTAVWSHLSVAGPPAAKLQLSQQRLTEFGGMREVVHQFKAAPCSESRCNMLSVMLDHVAWNLSEVRSALHKQASFCTLAGHTVQAPPQLCSYSSPAPVIKCFCTCWQKFNAGTLWSTMCMLTSIWTRVCLHRHAGLS